MATSVVTVVLLGASAEAVARRLAASGAAVVLVADEGSAGQAGELAAAIEADGAGRPAVYALSSPDAVDGLPAFVAELFPGG